jgi:8-oxo-dGTP pyrophosphatase MutT (NUDIX family)/GNAT superfamily N-acetyltransferase
MMVQVAQEQDVETWLVLAQEVEPLFGPLVGDPTFRRALDMHVARGTAFCIRQGDGPAGAPLLGGLLYSQHPPVHSIGWLAVAERARRRGIGRALVDHVVSLTQAPFVLVAVTFSADEPGGVSARTFYERLGFEAAEETPGRREGERRQVFRRRIDPDVIRRQVARVLLFDAADRILLFFMHEHSDPPDAGYWYLPGGGMDPGETPEETVRRELKEEAGITSAEIDHVIGRRIGVTFRQNGRDFEQDEWHVVARLAIGGVALGQPEDPEAGAVALHRWWPLETLAATEDRVYPADLATVARSLVIKR